MKKYCNLHGFTLTKTTSCPEQSATLVEYRHEQTGAPLFFLDRPDKNMTFAIGFRTVPTDDTGIFHILEHSVLCGSKKFPVKDPFSELLKGSISTFLNAFTYGDRTVYPVSSLNKKAFLDLVNVYLDAVLHPLALSNRNIFLQEGHRLEFDADGRLVRNGIVYNEMRGAYSSPDELAGYYEGRLAFPGGCFGFDSGGNPEHIPELTYEKFVEAHKKYYHPTNSILFLDGEVELDPVLALIDSYLREFDVGECFTEIPEGNGIITEPLTVEYPVASEDDEKDGTRITLVRRFGAHEDRAGFLSVALAAEAIGDTNTAPLKKRVLDSGLCKNFSFYPVSGMKYPTFITKFTDVKDGKEKELIELYRTVLGEILNEGIDKDSLLAALNSTEFSLREADYGSYPRGMVYMSSVMEDVVCGEYPAEGLKYNELFAFLREKLDTPHYVEALRKVFEREEAILVLRPSATAEARREAKESSALATVLADMSEEERQGIVRENENLMLWQSEPESEEALASIPALTIADLTGAPERVPTEVYIEDGVDVISHPIPSSGITYLDLLFDVSDLSEKDMAALSLMTVCAPELDTEGYTAAEFRNRIKTNLGGLSATALPIKKNGEARLYLQISLSTLEQSKSTALDILEEYLYTRKFEDEQTVKRRLAQLLTRRREGLLSGAAGSCIGRGAAMFDSFEALKEIVSGISFTQYVKRASESIPADELLAKFKALTESCLTRSRLTVSVTETGDAEFVRAAISKVRDGGTAPGKCGIKPLERRNEGIVLPAPVSYATATTNLITEGDSAFHGSLSTLGTILDFELLWNEIRIKGGAYGTGFVCRANSGTMGYYSYRDPSPERSVQVYRKMTDTLREFLDLSPELTKYIIGTVGPMETVTTPRGSGSLATVNYLSGKSYEDIMRAREESVSTTREDLYRAADMIDRAMQSAVVTVAGPREKLIAMELDEIIEI